MSAVSRQCIRPSRVLTLEDLQLGDRGRFCPAGWNELPRKEDPSVVDWEKILEDVYIGDLGIGRKIK